jgi:hypothetical protein
MMSRSISQTTAAISQITTAITTMVMIKLNAPRTLLTSSQLKGRDTPAKDTPALAGSYSPANPSLSCSSRTFAKAMRLTKPFCSATTRLRAPENSYSRHLGE